MSGAPADEIVTADEPGVDDGPEAGPADESAAPAAPGPGAARTAALLNLTGLGLGYLALGAWLRLAAALLVTAGLLLVVLPVTWQGTSPWWFVAYLTVLAGLAVDGWFTARRRARRGRVGGPAIAPAAAWPLLALVPAGIATYAIVQHELLERHLEQVVASAMADAAAVDDLGWGSAGETVQASYADLVDVTARYPRTRTAAGVPDHLSDLYRSAQGPTECESLETIRWFSSMTSDVGKIQPIHRRATDELPDGVLACAGAHLDGAEPAIAVPLLDELLADHAGSGAAERVVPELTAWRDENLSGLEDDPCSALDGTEKVASFFEAAMGPLAALADGVADRLPDGMYRCGLAHFDAGEFPSAENVMERFVERYPDLPELAYAERVRTAAIIARVYPESGRERPSAVPAGGPVSVFRIYNYSPWPAKYYFTGPDTGSVELAGCDACTFPDPWAAADGCTDLSADYPSATLTLPAGSYYFLQASGSLSITNRPVDWVPFELEPGASYWVCVAG
ncbi:hypothetical protein L1785_13135 [Antribacter sp. KLBMP9083]|uniref:Uncharacterized protein n=1 Tax=Antribacter soli TaxID=2910976 RepID=A0AA41U7S9_9MICO|nr:hypothetical protein [Antribacter soli]MCF4121921.1 hypothetical protein [Antribacter soli]